MWYYFSSVACFYKFVWSSSRGCIWGVCALGHYDFIFIREKMENIIPFEDPPSALTRTCQAAMVCANCFESVYTVLALDCYYSYIGLLVSDYSMFFIYSYTLVYMPLDHGQYLCRLV